eukprot:gene2534-3272_t
MSSWLGATVAFALSARCLAWEEIFDRWEATYQVVNAADVLPFSSAPPADGHGFAAISEGANGTNHLLVNRSGGVVNAYRFSLQDPNAVDYPHLLTS